MFKLKDYLAMWRNIWKWFLLGLFVFAFWFIAISVVMAFDTSRLHGSVTNYSEQRMRVSFNGIDRQLPFPDSVDLASLSWVDVLPPKVKAKPVVKPVIKPDSKPVKVSALVAPPKNKRAVWRLKSIFKKRVKSDNKIPDGVDMKKRGYKAVKNAAVKYGVPVNLALRIAKQESMGNCEATSHAGARGTMQVMPATGRKHGVKNRKHLYNCKVGAEAGVKELKYCLSKTKGNEARASICYNCGPACLKRKRLPRETINYVRIITGKEI